MDNFISACWILMEVLSQFLFSDCFLQRRKWFFSTYAFILITIVWLFVFANYYTGNIPILFIASITYFFLFLLCYKGSTQHRLISVLMCTLLLSTIDTLVVYTWNIFQNIGLQNIYQRKITYLSIGTISKSIGLLATWLAQKLRGQRSARKTQIRWLVLALLFPAVSLVMLVFVYSIFYYENDIPAYTLFFTIAIALGNIGIMYLISQLEKTEQENQNIALLNQQMEIQTQNILALEQSYRAQRTASHEFAHHLNTISTLLENQQYEIVLLYVREIQDLHPTRLFTINSHHPIIDAVLNQKYQVAKEKDIDMHIVVNDLSGITISTEALVVILSNLLDNAIEASASCNKRKTIQCSFILKETFFLIIENSSMPVHIVNGKILTTKRNKLKHGYGLDNVKRILDQLHSDYTFQYQDDLFRFVAEIPI